VLTDIL
jgi:T-complex protein 1 subunit eta